MSINTDKPYKIFAEVVEQTALDQFESAMQQPFVVRGALMPDVHMGYSLPIGAVVATDGVVVPAWVGFDIGCGMCAVKTSYKADDVKAHARDIFDGVYDVIPVGFSHNSRSTLWPDGENIPRTDTLRNIFSKNGLRQLGSLGGGNHFIEVGADEESNVWVIIHSGSRGIGHATASHYMRLASGDGKAREGHFGFDVQSSDGQDYIKDLNFCLEFAVENRAEMLRRVKTILSEFCTGSFDWGTLINRNHNHAEFEHGMWIHRKGATHALQDMGGVVPGNMRDGSFIVRGKGNRDALWSSSHGAGRVLGRKAAKRELSEDKFIESMRGVVAKVSADTLDESPSAYKDIYEVMRQQKDMVDIVAHVTPIVNIKS